MGIYDRDYYRQPTRSPLFSNMRVWSVNTWLIAINIAVFLIDLISQHQLYFVGYFSVTKAVFGLELWRFVTLQFLHASPQHILFNMIALFFFGPMVEQVLGARRYLAFYLLSGIASGAFYVLLWATHILVYDATTPLIGASGSIFGVLIAAARIAPNVTVMFDFFIPMKLRTVAWVLLAIAVFTVVRNGPNAGGEAAHIGGAIAGYCMIQFPVLLDWTQIGRGPRMKYRP